MIRTTDRKLVPFELRDVQRELHRDFTGRDIVSKARKHGISTYVLARFYAEVTTRPHTTAAVIAHKPDSTQALWSIVQTFYDCDPRRLSTRYASRHELFFDGLNSRFIVGTAGEGSGRGHTLNLLHLSELAWWRREVRATVGGLIASVPQGTGSSIVIESTSNGEGNEYHRRWLEAVSGESEFAAHFFPWSCNPEYRRPWDSAAQPPIGGDERFLVEALNLDLDQVAFLRWAEAEYGHALRRQEFPSTWQESFLSSGRGVFDREILLGLEREHCRAPIVSERDGVGSLSIWSPPVRGRRYFGGADTAEGVEGGDAQAFKVIDAETLEEVAALRGHWPIHVYARKLSALALRYRAFCAIERNNHGHAVLEHLLRGDDDVRLPRELIYHHRGYDAKGKAVRRPGFPTDGKTKPILIADLEEAIRTWNLRARSPHFYAEARAYAYLDDGSMGAPDGSHDDEVMAMALAVAARKARLAGAGFSGEESVPLPL